MQPEDVLILSSQNSSIKQSLDIRLQKPTDIVALDLSVDHNDIYDIFTPYFNFNALVDNINIT